MTLSTLYFVINGAIVPAWLLLLVLPRWRHTQRIAIGTSIALAAFYLVAFLLSLGSGSGNILTLEGVRKALSHPDVLLYAWAHYLAFDLLVGAWEVREAQRLGIAHGWLVPCLLFTLMLGPIGFLLFMCLRILAKRKIDARVDSKTSPRRLTMRTKILWPILLASLSGTATIVSRSGHDHLGHSWSGATGLSVARSAANTRDAAITGIASAGTGATPRTGRPGQLHLPLDHRIPSGGDRHLLRRLKEWVDRRRSQLDFDRVPCRRNVDCHANIDRGSDFEWCQLLLSAANHERQHGTIAGYGEFAQHRPTGVENWSDPDVAIMRPRARALSTSTRL